MCTRFRAAGNGNSNARIISHILQYNKNITELDLSNNGIDDDGIREICIGLARNNTLKKLNLAANHFGEVGAQSLTLAIAENSSLVELDLSRNALGFRSISTVLCACNPKGVNVGTSGNYVFEEILNSVSHGIAFIGSIIGGKHNILPTFFDSFNFLTCFCLLFVCHSQYLNLRSSRYLSFRLSFLGMCVIFLCFDVFIFIFLFVSFVLYASYQ